MCPWDHFKGAFGFWLIMRHCLPFTEPSPWVKLNDPGQVHQRFPSHRRKPPARLHAARHMALAVSIEVDHLCENWSHAWAWDHLDAIPVPRLDGGTASLFPSPEIPTESRLPNGPHLTLGQRRTSDLVLSVALKHCAIPC